VDKPQHHQCENPLGLCVKSDLGRLVLPKAQCGCGSSLGSARISLPPIFWFSVGAGAMVYALASNWTDLAQAWGQEGLAGLGRVVLAFSNSLFILSGIGVLLVLGGVRELVLRKKGLENQQPT